MEGAACSWNLSAVATSAPPPSSSKNCTLFLAKVKGNVALWHSFHKVQGTRRLQWGGEEDLGGRGYMLVKLAHYEGAAEQNPSSWWPRPLPLRPLPVCLPCYVTGWYKAEEFLLFPLHWAKPLSAHIDSLCKEWFITHWECETKKDPICPMRQLHCLELKFAVKINRFPQSTVQALDAFTLTAVSEYFSELLGFWHPDTIKEVLQQTESLPHYSAAVGTCSECSAQSWCPPGGTRPRGLAWLWPSGRHVSTRPVESSRPEMLTFVLTVFVMTWEIAAESSSLLELMGRWMVLIQHIDEQVGQTCASMRMCMHAGFTKWHDWKDSLLRGSHEDSLSGRTRQSQWKYGYRTAHRRACKSVKGWKNRKQLVEKQYFADATSELFRKMQNIGKLAKLLPYIKPESASQQ